MAGYAVILFYLLKNCRTARLWSNLKAQLLCSTAAVGAGHPLDIRGTVGAAQHPQTWPRGPWLKTPVSKPKTKAVLE